MARKIPSSGINLFQLIYILKAEYTEKTGLDPLNLSLGNPDGVPPQEILNLQATYAADPAFEFHTYAEDTNLMKFVEGMVAIHGQIEIDDYPALKGVPIPGIKGATTLLTLACGLHLPDKARRQSFTLASNLPAYDVVGTWSTSYIGGNRVVWPLASSDNMRLNVARLKSAMSEAGLERADLVHVIRPGNPAAVGASSAEWREVIEYCISHKTRLVNDAAYAGLVASDSHVPLAVVAKDYPELEWVEMYSVSKSYNDPGARLGALVGSKDFVEDYIMIKGNTDSGPVPSVMAAYGEYFQNRSAAKRALAELSSMYSERLSYIIPRFKEAGLHMACDTEAGFFTLWQVPRKVLGVELSTDPRTAHLPAHEAFNRLVIAETGIVGVHFRGPEINGRADSLIRYAVCTDVLAPEFQRRFEEGLERLKPEY
jgi:aspartate/methionine/tyrosine aminotransferase